MANCSRISVFIKFKGTFNFNNLSSCHLNPYSINCKRTVHCLPHIVLNAKTAFANLDYASKLFDEMIQTRPLPAIAKFDQLLDGVTNMKHFTSSLNFFKQMCAIGIPVDEYSMSIAIRCYCQLYRTKDGGLTVLGCFYKRGFVPGVSIYNTLLNGFILEDRTHEAERLFKNIIKKEVCEPNVVTYNTMIKGLCKIGNNFTALGLIRLMDLRGGCKPDLVTYNTLIDSFCNDVMIDDAFKLFNEMVIKKTISPTLVTYNSMISALCKLGRWDDVSRTLKQLEDGNISPDVQTFNILIEALCKQGKIKEAEVVFDIMVRSGKYYPDIMTYNSLITSHCLRFEMKKAEKLLRLMVFRGVKPDIVTYNYLLYGYCMSCKLDEATDMYTQILKKAGKPKPNIVTNFIMSEVSFRFRFPKRDLEQGQIRSIFTYKTDLTLLSCKAYEVEKALPLIHFIDEIEGNVNSFIDSYNIILNCAINCGNFDISRRLFHDIFVNGLEPDDETYTLLFTGFCQGGLLRNAKQLFFKMEKSDFPPNNVIYNDLIVGYLKNKPLDDLWILIKKLKGRGYLVSAANCSLVMYQALAIDRVNHLNKFFSTLSPNEWGGDNPYYSMDIDALFNEDQTEKTT